MFLCAARLGIYGETGPDERVRHFGEGVGVVRVVRVVCVARVVCACLGNALTQAELGNLTRKGYPFLVGTWWGAHTGHHIELPLWDGRVSSDGPGQAMPAADHRLVR